MKIVIEQINDIRTNKLEMYSRLNEAQLLHYNEPELGIFIAESPNVTIRAIDAGYEPISMVMLDKHVNGEAAPLIEKCKALKYDKDMPVYVADENILSGITGFKMTRGVLCAMKRKPLPSIKDICADKKRIVILEDVVNPTNVGAIFRSAAALNMDAVLLTAPCSDPLYRRAARVSMGTVFQIPWTYIPGDVIWPQLAMQELHGMGFKTVAMALRDDSVSIDDKQLMSEDKLAIIMGTEGAGLCGSTIDNSDYTVMIPMSHGVDSLNVAAASAVAFWQLGQNNTGI